MNMRTTKQAPRRGVKLAAKFAAISASIFALHSTSVAAVKTFVGNSGTSSFPGGTWDFNNTARWTEGGYQALAPWTDNGDIAVIELAPNSNGHMNINIDDSFGAVGAAGIIMTNSMNGSDAVNINGSALAIGSAGVDVLDPNSKSFVSFYTPIVLAAGQTWSNVKRQINDNHGTVRARSALSSAAGKTTPMLFYGNNVADPALCGKTDVRPGFGLYADNTFSGSTTVAGSAALSLCFSTTYPGQRLDPQSPLIMNGGTVYMVGNTATYTQIVASVVIKSGHNFITGMDGKGAFFCNQIVRDGLGGTLNTTVDWAGGVSFHISNTNENGIVGGWHVSASRSFARGGGSTGNAATQRGSTDGWNDNDNVLIAGNGMRTKGDVSPNSLCYYGVFTNDFDTATVTVKSGGILAPETISNGSRLTGGRLRSGMDTGELFIHAFRQLAIDSIIEDNGATPCVLVKSGHHPLALSGANTYTGDTYLNGGTLALEGDASMSGPCHQAGGTILSFSKGARLAPLSGGYALGGNLLLGAGAVVEVQADSNNAQGVAAPAVTLENPWGSFTVSATENAPASLGISFGDTNALRPGDTFRIVEWQPSTVLSGVAPEAFALSLPRYMEGELVVAPTGLDLVVTQTPGIATLILLR
jgi:autotransporter-associated beta strand repeat